MLAIHSSIHCHDAFGYYGWINPCNQQLKTKQHNPDFPPRLSTPISFRMQFLHFFFAIIDTYLDCPIMRNYSLVLLINRHQFNNLIIQCIHHALFFEGLVPPSSRSLFGFLLSSHGRPTLFVGLSNLVLELKSDIINTRYVGQHDVFIFECLCRLLVNHHSVLFLLVATYLICIGHSPILFICKCVPHQTLFHDLPFGLNQIPLQPLLLSIKIILCID